MPILGCVRKYELLLNDFQHDSRLTLALNALPSRSTENRPGSSVRFCWCPRVIIDVPYWTRFPVVPDAVISTNADNDETMLGDAVIITVSFSSNRPKGNVRAGIYSSLKVASMVGSICREDEQ